ncbi:MAG: TssN family type VI secretion system protein [Bacteroidales bacterium]|jgi:hypothetical protein|nr:TssN family type VI secretion system protein [Bacteroidales bacterium]
MSSAFLTILTTYLLMPILAIVMGVVSWFMAKRSKLLSQRKLIFYILLGAVVLCVPALLGFVRYQFMPCIYLSLQATYLILGYYNVIFLRRFLSRLKKENSFWHVIIIQFVMMFAGAALFSTVFNLCNELKYGIWACTCLLPFLFAPLFRETYNRYMSIPPEIYKVWKYSGKDLSQFEMMNYDKLLLMEVELYKIPADPAPTKIRAKAPDNMPFGLWFFKFLTDYNLKFPLETIECDNTANPYSWIFYIKRSFFIPRKYIDPDLSIIENRLKERYTIVAKRVSETSNNEIK